MARLPGNTMRVQKIQAGGDDYPARLIDPSNFGTPMDLFAIGDTALLASSALGLICSVRCPGSVVIKTFDAIRELRDAGVVCAGGFHSPMEQECLEFLLRGKQPVIVCPAKHPNANRLAPVSRSALETGQLLVLSPFGSDARRTTKVQAQRRNEFVAALSTAVLLPHASPGGKAEITAQNSLNRNQPLFTFADDENQYLIGRGARPYDVLEIKRLVAAGGATLKSG